jgi:xylono-1,5-lactonase
VYAAIDEVFLTGAVPGIVARKEQHELRNIVGPAVSAERDSSFHLGASGWIFERLQLGRELGFDDARVNAVDPDAELPELLRRCARHATQRPLRRAVGGVQLETFEAGDRGDVDDRTAETRRDHGSRCRSRSEEDSGLVHREHLVPLIKRGVDQRSLQIDRGVVHHDVETAVLLNDGAHNGVPFVFAAHVEVHIARALDAYRRLCAKVVENVGQHDRGSLRCKQATFLGALPTSTTRYQRNPAIQSTHSPERRGQDDGGGSVRFVTWELLASGYGLVEGPTIDSDGSLVFSDVLDGGVYRLHGDGAAEMLVPKRRGVGGIARHADGGFVIGGRELVHVGNGDDRVVATIDGALGLNDFGTDDAGRIYVGSVRYRSLDPSAVAVPGELWRVDLDGTASMLYGDVLQCNGVAISSGGTTMYHADTRGHCVVVHDLVDDATAVANRRHWSMGPRSQPDGLALDVTGCLWVADHGAGRVVRFTPDGRIDSVLTVPARHVTTLCFDGADLIVVTAGNDAEPQLRGSIFRTTTQTAGARVHPARV